MNGDFWGVLGLQKATLEHLERLAPDGDVQPAPFKMGLARADEIADEVDLESLRSQTPVKRIVNTLLLCAVRDHASRMIVEPEGAANQRGVNVRYTVGEKERDHLKLPLYVLKPIVAHFREMARASTETPEFSGKVRLTVDGRTCDLLVSAQTTPRGEHLTVDFCWRAH